MQSRVALCCFSSLLSCFCSRLVVLFFSCSSWECRIIFLVRHNKGCYVDLYCNMLAFVIVSLRKVPFNCLGFITILLVQLVLIYCYTQFRKYEYIFVLIGIMINVFCSCFSVCSKQMTLHLENSSSCGGTGSDTLILFAKTGSLR